MLDAVSTLNWLAILIASVAQFLLGGIWFMGLFRRHYAAALQLPPTSDEKPGLRYILGPFACGMVTVATAAVLLRLLQVTTVADALALGALIGGGLIGATVVNIAINPRFPRPLYYSLINVPYFVLGSLLSALILVLMG